MRTLNAAWIAAARAAKAPRFILTLTDGSVTFKAINRGGTGLSAYPMALAHIGSFASRMSLPDRQISSGFVEVLLEDSFVRPRWQSYRLKGMKATLEIGFNTITEANYEELFVGVLDELVPTASGEFIGAKLIGTTQMLISQPIVGYWLSKHQLGVMGDVLGTKLDLDSTLYDASTFDPDDAAYDDISHFVVNRASIGPFGMNNGINAPTPALQVLNELAMISDGMFGVSEVGTLRFKRFDPTASNVAAWTRTEILKLRQVKLNDNVINRVEFAYSPEMLDTVASVSGFVVSGAGASTQVVTRPTEDIFDAIYRADNTDSQTNHAYPGMGARILTHSMSSKWLSAWALISNAGRTTNLNDSDTSAVMIGPRVGNFCGTRESYPAADQPANAKISSGRPLYLQTDRGEIIKATSFVPVSDGEISVMRTRNPVTLQLEDAGTFHHAWAVSGMTRGMFGTSAAPAVTVVDVTVPAYIADRVLERHHDGLSVLEVETDLSQLGVEVGDFVGITWPAYVAYAKNGLDGTEKFEVLSKQVEMDGIKWVVAQVVVATPTTARAGMSGLRSRGLAATFRQGAKDQDTFLPHVTSGLVVTHTSGLQVSVSAGRASIGVLSSDLDTATLLALKANTTHWVHFDVETDALFMSVGATKPLAPWSAVFLAKVVTDGSTVTTLSTAGRNTDAIVIDKVAASGGVFASNMSAARR